MIYVKTLNLLQVCCVIFHGRFSGNKREVYLLSEPSTREKIYLKFLELIGFKVSELNFLAGALNDEFGENLVFKASRISTALSIKQAGEILSSVEGLDKIDKKYAGNAGLLSYAKKIQIEIFEDLLILEIVNYFKRIPSAKVIIKKSIFYKQIDLNKSYPDINIIFVEFKSVRYLKLGIVALRYFLNLYRLKIIHLFNDDQINYHLTGKPSVLTFQENTNIRESERLKAQPHYWLDGCLNEKYSAYILERPTFGLKISKRTKDAYLQQGITILPESFYYKPFSDLSPKAVGLIAKTVKDRNKLFLKLIFGKDFLAKSYILNLLILAQESIGLIGLIDRLNARVLLIREPQFRHSDAINLIKDSLDVKTITYQYSNLGRPSPQMLSISDYFVVFSKIFIPIFSIGSLRPGNIIEMGYPYDFVMRPLKKYSDNIKAQLRARGVNFTICLFDESVSDSKFGLIDRSDHYNELKMLIDFVSKNTNVGLIIKTQYIKNNPSILYPRDRKLNQLISSGRYLEVSEGHNRNEVYPAEVALASDVCISHKFGATAGLEAALTGCRVILLNKHLLATNLDFLYAKSRVEVNSMKQAVKEIEGLYLAKKGFNDVGDWSAIIDKFDKFRDGMASNRMANLITSILDLETKHARA